MTPSQSSNGRYGAHVWLNAFGDDGWQRFPNVPPDAFYEEGVFGQRILVVPSMDLVICVLSGYIEGKAYHDIQDFYTKVFECME